MAIKKKTRKKKRNTKKKDNIPYRYLIALLIIGLIFAAIFQFGIIGVGIDSLFTYFTGSARFYVYILILLTTIYYTVNQKMIPLNRRVNGWLLMLVALPSFLQVIAHILNGKPILPLFNSIYELQSRSGIHFFGGGIIGYLYDIVFSTLISTFGSLLLSLLMITISTLLILGRSIRLAAERTFLWIMKYLRLLIDKVTDFAKKDRNTHHNEVIDVSDLPVLTQDAEDIPIYDSVQQFDSNEDLGEAEAFISTSKDVPSNTGNVNLESVVHTSATTEDENPNYKLPPITLLHPAAEKAKNNMQDVKNVDNY